MELGLHLATFWHLLPKFNENKRHSRYRDH